MNKQPFIPDDIFDALDWDSLPEDLDNSEIQQELSKLLEGCVIRSVEAITDDIKGCQVVGLTLYLEDSGDKITAVQLYTEAGPDNFFLNFAVVPPQD